MISDPQRVEMFYPVWSRCNTVEEKKQKKNAINMLSSGVKSTNSLLLRLKVLSVKWWLWRRFSES